jgi:enoyl-CoA hydratase/carnithine racemase
MPYEEIILKKEGGVATLILNRPEKLNSITWQMRKEIIEAIAEVNEDDKIRVLVLTGAGDRAFSAGADVGGAIAAGRSEITRKQVTERVGFYPPRIREMRVPTIAAINGLTIGISLSITLACDIRIASDKARFACTWVNIGLVPDGGATYLLTQAVGPAKALELALSADMINAEEALRIGLVNRVVPHEDLMKVTGELAAKLADKAPIALELTKYGVYRGLESDIKGALDFESYANKLCLTTEDNKEGIKALQEKRKPEFKGR